jgi:hypothetical protein
MPILVEHVFSLIAVVLMNQSHIQNQKTCHFPDWVLQMVDGSQTWQNINAPQQCLLTTGSQLMLLTGQQIHPIGMMQRHRLQPTHQHAYATYAFPRICNGSHQRDPRRRKQL